MRERDRKNEKEKLKITLSNWTKQEDEFYKESYNIFLKNYRDYFSNPFFLTTRQQFASSYARIKIYELVKNIKGSIVECGVHKGNHLLLFYHLMLCNEPTSFNDKIIGFDTFAGFKAINKNKDNKNIKNKDFANVNYNLLKEIIKTNQKNDLIKHIPRVEIIKGDACKTIPKYLIKNKSLIIKLLYLDFDIFAPTVKALENFYKLVPKGGIIAFDELGTEKWVGETIAYKKFFKKKNLMLRKFEFEPWISYLIKE